MVIHCTHGLNRAGYFIARVLIALHDWNANQALIEFATRYAAARVGMACEPLRDAVANAHCLNVAGRAGTSANRGAKACRYPPCLQPDDSSGTLALADLT